MSRDKTTRRTLDFAAHDRRRTTLIRVASTAVLVIFAIVIGVLILTHTDADNPAAAPAAVTESGAIRLPADTAPTVGVREQPRHVLTIYEDFQCPICKKFESTFGGAIDALRNAGTVAVHYHPIAILDRSSSTHYSTRAANASLCVADESTATWQKFHTALFEHQPPEGGAGLNDRTLIDIARGAGASEAIGDCITADTFSDWITASTNDVLAGGVSATPTVELDGHPIDLTTPDALTAAVAAAVK
ncbi:DsbA family protein [Rhodococcus sp. NM-2]|uniref:DsbA family protein n=1 Tax=Rhodococcus sp. NM-2 TaxID=3401174 RepID=UPI003AAA3297